MTTKRESSDQGDKGLAGVIKSAKRVLELLELFAERRQPLTVMDVVKGMNVPQSSASALLKSLVRLGFLDYDRFTRLYTPTIRVSMLGGWIHDQMYSDRTLFSVVEELHRASGSQVVVLGMQNDIYAQYIHLVQRPSSEIPWYIKPGSLRPLCRSAIGRVLLSLKSDVEVQQLLWRINAEEETVNRISIHDLLKELDTIRRQGYALTRGTVTATTGVIAIRMPTPPGQPPMAIGIGGAIDVIDRERDRFLDLLRAAIAPYAGRTALPSTTPGAQGRVRPGRK